MIKRTGTTNKQSAKKPPPGKSQSTIDKLVKQAATVELTIDQVADAKLRRRLEAECLSYRVRAEQMNELKKLNEKSMAVIRPLAEQLEADRVKGDSWTLARFAGRKQLSKELLVENGVDIETIEASMKATKGGWRITGVKEGNGETTDD